MKRRDFLKDIAVGSLIFHSSPWIFSQEKTPPLLAVAEGESPSEITRTAVDILGGMNNFISRNDQVVVKPNIGWDRAPEQAACTNPQVVAAVVEMCLNAGAREVKVLDNTINPARRTYARSGIAKAAKEAGAKVVFPNPHRLKKIPLKGEWLKEWEIYTDFIETDKIINIPIAKTHSLSRLTLGMKNWLGAVGGNRGQLHQGLDQVMIDLSSFFKPVMTILDAYRILWRNGPQGGRLSDVQMGKTVVAGIDQVAVDAYGTTFFEIKPQELRYLQLAQERGLGESRLEKIKIEKRTV